MAKNDDRLAAALRENLRRRKAQGRAREESPQGEATRGEPARPERTAGDAATPATSPTPGTREPSLPDRTAID